MSATLRHPGPRAAERRPAVRAALRPIEGRLAAGGVLMDEVAALFAAAGCRGGILWLDGLVCEPFRYVLPALARDAAHAAFYSDTFAPEGRVRVDAATASVGWREGCPFLHGHGLWHGAFGHAMGHVLPHESVVAEDVVLRGLGAAGAWFEARPDAETNFTLFGPAGGEDGGSLIARLAPGEDVCKGVEALAAAHGIAQARVHGLGSICHARFEDGSAMACVATEVRIEAGHVAHGRAEIAASVVDVEGRVASGHLRRGANPVGVTFELVLESA